MSKLGIVIWAAVFLGSAKLDAAGAIISGYSEPLEIINRAVAKRHIDRAIGKINERSSEVFEKVLNFGPQDGSERLTVIAPFLNTIALHTQALKSSANHYVTVGKKKGTFNETECNMYLNDYLKATNEHVLNLKSVLFYQIYNDATMWIGKLFEIANAEKDRLKELKARTTTCNGNECNQLSDTAQNIWKRFLENTAEALNFYGSMADGTAIVNTFQYKWNYYIDMGQEVLRLVYNCTHNPKDL